MNSYNGYTPQQRTKALKWFRAAQARGEKSRHPESCDICGQTEGHLEWHSEDYSEPFDLDHIGKFGLCYPCHMMIHCRFKNKEAWKVYGESIKEGFRFRIKGRNWQDFAQFFLYEKCRNIGRFHAENTNYQLFLDIGAGKFAGSGVVTE